LSLNPNTEKKKKEEKEIVTLYSRFKLFKLLS
jgi:hypothetical protein